MDKRILLIVAVLIAVLIAAGFILFTPAGNQDHTYGEKVGAVAAPSLNECVLNGVYYPISSGKCTINVTLEMHACGGGGAGVYNGTDFVVTSNGPLNGTHLVVGLGYSGKV